MTTESVLYRDVYVRLSTHDLLLVPSAQVDRSRLHGGEREMIVGCPKEIKDSENRVALTPAGARALVAAGHECLVEKAAGKGSGFSDQDYAVCGAKLVDDGASVWNGSEMVVKVKEPLPEEYGYFRSDLILFTYLHLAPVPKLTEALLKSGITGIAYETVQLDDGTLPLLVPMSEVAGRAAIVVGSHYLAHPQGGPGCLIGGVPGVAPAEVVIIGGGVVGLNAAKMAAGLGARVTILDVHAERMKYLDDILPRNCVTMHSDPNTVEECLTKADLVVGAVLVTGSIAPKVVTHGMLSLMRPRSVVVDVAVDQGGCFETTRATTHMDPVYFEEGILHYAVTNIPGAFPRTSTRALTNVTFPYVLEIANKGAARAVLENACLARGVNTWRGKLTCPGVAASQNLRCDSLDAA
jgi:alanine dehydrogenase